MQLTFGDYVEVYDWTDSVSKRRMIICIALYSCAIAAFSSVLTNITTHNGVHRSQWTCMNTTQEFIDTMNNLNWSEILIDPIVLNTSSPS